MSASRIYMLGFVCTAVYGCLSAVTNEPEKPVTPPVVIDQPTPAVGQPQPAQSAAAETAPVSAETQMVAYSHPAKQSAPGCQCPGDCCPCDPSKVPHYWHSGKWHPCKVMTVEEAERENASLVPMRAARPVQPVRKLPRLEQQPMFTVPLFQSGGCANGQCGTSGGSRRFFGRR